LTNLDNSKQKNPFQPRLLLKEIYHDAIKRREEIVSVLKDHKYDTIIQEAKNQWNEFEPEKIKKKLCGIDSSFNAKKFQGIELWAVDAVSIRTDSEILSKKFDFGLSRHNDNASQSSSSMEIDVCDESVDQSDLVLMDGSIYSQFIMKKESLLKRITKVITRRNNVVFVSKTSNANLQFSKMGSIAGDIFYFNHASRKAGFSKPYLDNRLGKARNVTITYARMADDVPLIKIELLGKDHDENSIKSILNSLKSESRGGYPYSLKMAHDTCKISMVDLNKLVSLFGISNEIGSRDVLE